MTVSLRFFLIFYGHIEIDVITGSLTDGHAYFYPQRIWSAPLP